MKLTFVYGLTLLMATGCGVDTLPAPDDPNAGPDAGGGGESADAAPPVEVDNRVTDALQLLYRFEGAPGQTVIDDVSGVGDPIPLTLRNPAAVTWEGGGMTFIEPTVAENLSPLTKVVEACQASTELSLELWIKNATIESNGYIVTSSQEATLNVRNFGIHQQNDNWDFHLRTSQTGQNGANPTADALPGAATIEEQHVVYTRDATSQVANFYINGQKLVPREVPGNFGNWAPEYGMYVGAEPTLDRAWLGTIYLAAVYCKELSQAEVLQNYNEGY